MLIMSVLCLAVSDGKKSLNLSYRLDAPGMFEIAGTTLMYQRDLGGKHFVEKVFILGPTNSDINVTVSSSVCQRRVLLSTS